MRDRAAIDLEVRSREGGGSEPQQGGGAALPRRPAPVQRGVVAGEGLEAGRKSAERHQLTAALGVLQRRTRGVEAGSVDLGGGDARLEAGGDGPEAAGDDPCDVGEAEVHLVQDLPDGPSGGEEHLELVAQRNGEARGERCAPAAGEIGGRAPPRPLSGPPGARGGGGGGGGGAPGGEGRD